MAEEVDVQSSKPEAVVAGVRQLASAALSAPGATAAQVELAIAVLEASSTQADREPAEAASIAAVFNRQHDAILDAANASATKRDRVTRRAMLARAVDQAGLVILDQATVADFFARHAAAHPPMSADVESAARFLDDLLEHHSPEAALQWRLVRQWMTPGAPQSDENSDAARA